MHTQSEEPTFQHLSACKQRHITVKTIDGTVMCVVQRAAVLISGLSELNPVAINFFFVPWNALGKC
jgi:hypothetical protein